jgi:hypothetical protein
MTPAIIKAVVDEIHAYGKGERAGPLSWSALETFAGFSRVSLWAKPTIKEAFQQVNAAQRRDATPRIKAPRTTDERIDAMQRTVDELREIVRAYDERWVLYEYNVQRLGLDPGELRRPLDPLVREQLRSRRVRRVR